MVSCSALFFALGCRCSPRNELVQLARTTPQAMGTTAAVARHDDSQGQVQFADWRSVHAVSAGANGSCVNGTFLVCWGTPLGREAATTKPVVVAKRTDLVQVSRSNSHACVTTRSAEVWCLGRNEDGELGAPSSEECDLGPLRNGVIEKYRCSSSLVLVSGIPASVDVVAGHLRTCSISREGTVYCWGLKQEQRSKTPVAVPPQAVPGLDDVRRLALGAFFSCALSANGSVKCWGANQNGELGRGNPTGEIQNMPMEVEGVSRAVDIGAGDNHACALVQEGAQKSLKCWGMNRSGQLGVMARCSDEICARAQTSLLPAELVGAEELVMGGDSTCIRSHEGALFCMGSLNGRALGDSPARVPGIPALATAANGGTHIAAITRDGHVLSWGAQLLDHEEQYAIKCDECATKATRIPGVFVPMLPPATTAGSLPPNP